MTLDINAVVPQGRQLIQSYGDGRFKITGVAHEGSVIVFPEETVRWHAGHIGEITPESLHPVFDAEAAVDILLIGCGMTFEAVPKGLRAALKESGIVLEWMDTGAACRTYNVLVAEERRVAAAILAVD